VLLLLSLWASESVLKIDNISTLQLAMMEKRVKDKSNPLTASEIQDDLSLRFKRLNEEQNEETKNDNNQEIAFFGGQFKGKCQNFLQSDIKQRIVN
jgi:hypothetical protein